MFQCACCSDWQNRGLSFRRLRTLQQIHFWMIGLMLSNRGHAKDLPLLGDLFSGSYVFELLTQKVYQSYQKWCPKICFGGKLTLNGKNS